MRRRSKTADEYERENSEAAAIIAADPDRYAGPLLQWAEMWRKKRGAAAIENHSAVEVTQLRLFRKEQRW